MQSSRSQKRPLGSLKGVPDPIVSLLVWIWEQNSDPLTEVLLSIIPNLSSPITWGSLDPRKTESDPLADSFRRVSREPTSKSKACYDLQPALLSSKHTWGTKQNTEG